MRPPHPSDRPRPHNQSNFDCSVAGGQDGDEILCAPQSNHENHGRSPGLIRRESSVPGSIRNCEIERPKRSRRARDSRARDTCERDGAFGPLLVAIDRIAIAIFVVEILARLAM